MAAYSQSNPLANSDMAARLSFKDGRVFLAGRESNPLEYSDSMAFRS